jgi:hypothetical protein
MSRTGTLQDDDHNGSTHLTSAQVTNITDAIKIACDFICIANLLATQKLVSEFREHHLATNSGDDVLQLRNILWWACVWLSEQTWSLPTTVKANNTTEDLPTADVNEDIVMMDVSGYPSADPCTPNPIQGDLRTTSQRKLAKYNKRRKAKVLRGSRKVNPEHKE